MILLGLTLACCSIAPDQLRMMPHVASISVRPVAVQARRVIRILDWHFVSERSFRLDTPNNNYSNSTFLDTVAAVQAEQCALIKAMGVTTVFYKGMSDRSVSHFRERVPVLNRSAPPRGNGPVDRRIAQIRRKGELQLGAPGRMLMALELDDVLPAEDGDLYAAANPAVAGRLAFNLDANRRREAAIAQRLLAAKEAVVVLGGNHDLEPHLPNDVEYIRVSVSAYLRATEE